MPLQDDRRGHDEDFRVASLADAQLEEVLQRPVANEAEFDVEGHLKGSVVVGVHPHRFEVTAFGEVRFQRLAYGVSRWFVGVFEVGTDE